MQRLEDALRLLADRAEPLPTEVLIARIGTELGVAYPAVAEREEPTMVTRQEPRTEIPPPTPPPPQRSRRGPLLAGAVAVVVILAGVGIAFATGLFEPAPTATERLAVATDLVDTWSEGWENYDADVVTSVFADDGVYIIEGKTVTKDLMKYEVWANPRLSNVDRVGELTPTGDETYTWVLTFDVNSSRIRYQAPVEIELDGDLAARIEWLEDFEVVERVDP